MLGDQMPNRHDFLRVKEAAELLGVSSNTIRAWGGAGMIPDIVIRSIASDSTSGPNSRVCSEESRSPDVEARKRNSQLGSATQGQRADYLHRFRVDRRRVVAKPVAAREPVRIRALPSSSLPSNVRTLPVHVYAIRIATMTGASAAFGQPAGSGIFVPHPGAQVND